MTKLVNRAKMTTATTGTGTITLGSASSGYQSFADAGVADSDVVRYVIEDGVNWEIGTGTYTASGTTLSRTVSESSNSDTAITLSGNAVVYITAVVADILQPDNNLSDLTSASTARTNLGLGSIATQAANNVSISGGSITGITDLAVSDGGTGASSFTANNVLLGNGTSAFQVVAPGTSGNVLTSNGTTWTSATPVTGATSINGLSDGYAQGSSVGLGSGALDSDDGTNNENTALGVDALTGFTSGLLGTGQNTAVGYLALSTSTETYQTTSIGAYSLRNVTSGGNNVAVGFEAGLNVTTGGSGVFVGSSAGRNVTTATRPIAVGRDALFGSAASNLTGTDNIGIGYQAGYDLSTGANNFLGGYRAGYDLTTGSNNIAFGNGALDAATTGGRNIAIGQDAMGLGIATAASGDNIAIGYQAGYDLTSGTDNVLIGELAGANITTGVNNVVIGKSAFDAATTGAENIAIGNEAMGAGVATEALGFNIAIGRLAGNNITTGQYNLCLGASSMSNFLNTGSNNVALGRSSGRLASGDQNVYVGALAGEDSGSATNQIIVGYDAQASSATVSNEITLGNTSITNFRVPGVGLQFDTTDGLIVPKTVTAGGTTGAQTINKTAGTVNFAAAATSLVVTNSFVDTNSIIIATVGTNDVTMTSVQAVAAAGSFTLYANVAATAETRVNWFVVN